MRKSQSNLFEFEIFDKFAKGEKIMADGGMDAVANALERLADRIDKAMDTGRSRGRRRELEEEDPPESAAPTRRGRRDPLEIQGVMFQLNVPVGRRGDTMPCYVLFPPVRDERELEKLADEVEREFRTAKVYTPKPAFDRSNHGYNGGGGNSYYRGNGYDRDRDYRR
jgi:hypothetical protein